MVGSPVGGGQVSCPRQALTPIALSWAVAGAEDEQESTVRRTKWSRGVVVLRACSLEGSVLARREVVTCWHRQGLIDPWIQAQLSCSFVA